VWASRLDADRGIAKLQRRIDELEAFVEIPKVRGDTSAKDIAVSNTRETIREVFGDLSPEFQEHQSIRMWGGPMYMGMEDHEIATAEEVGRVRIIGTLRGLIARIEEKAADFVSEGGAASPRSTLDYLNLHPRIAGVASELFEDGHHWQAVFEASKALVNYVKERSGKHDLDGTNLMRTVFSKNAPVLKFNNLSSQTELDEQEGMMHLFEGVVLGIRNPGGHAFPEGTEQRAVEYLSLISLLAYRAQEAQRVKP
jgi:uncharacterized protein (TIGR02391 family)